MLVRDDGTAWTAITQPAHAHLAGQVAAHWADPLAPDVVLACEQHDVAWSAWDRTPPLHDGRAAAFFEADAGDRLALWEDVAARLDAQSPYAAVLVSLHGTNVHTRYGAVDDDRLGPLLDAFAREQDELLARLPQDRAQAEADADVVFALDQLSLVVCHGWDGRELPPVRGTAVTIEPRGDETWALDPWPLRVPEAVVRVPVRRLTERFGDEAALHAALAARPYEPLVVTLRPV